jgi:flagellar protein FliS
MKHPALTYRQLSIQSATPLGLVVMLYDGAIAFLHRAIEAMEARDIEKKCHHLNRALAVIIQLEGSLNFEQGGEVARTLQAFYMCARAQMQQANIENSTEILRELIEHFTALRDAWQEGERRLTTRTAQDTNPPATESRASTAPKSSLTGYSGSGSDWDDATTVLLSVIE